jgi:predicted dehydrogenase
VRQLGSQLTNGDTLAALVTFRRGGHALITAILATPFAGRFAVYGSQGLGRGARQDPPGAPQGWTLTTCLRGEPTDRSRSPPAPAVLHNLEAFADAAEGRAPYPVPREQMVANISALEAIFKSAASGQIERVEG